MKILIAPDKFKGSLTAALVANALAQGLLDVNPDLEITELPIADGGDGTVDAAVAAGFTRHPITVQGPTGEAVATSFAMRGQLAVVELANACGLVRLPGNILQPMTSGTTGLGQVILAALNAGARSIVLGVGGSASTDGGAGMLIALGVRILDTDGRPIEPGGAGLADTATVDVSGLDARLSDTEIILANDVSNPLLGGRGAAFTYGRQKGADDVQLARLEAALELWSRLLPGGQATAALPGAGAAGGAGFAALAVLDAVARPGIEVMLELTGFADQLSGADLVITGEGSLDEQTLQGKGPAGVAAAAHSQGIEVIAVAGRVTLDPSTLRSAGIVEAFALSEYEPDPARSMSNAAPLLRQVGASVAKKWCPPPLPTPEVLGPEERTS